MLKTSVWAVVLMFTFAADVTSQQSVTTPRVAEAQAELRLMGIATSDDRTGLAIIGLPDGRVQFLKVGDALQDHTVTAIEAGRVLLKNAQGEMVLELVGGNPNGRPASDVAPGSRVT